MAFLISIIISIIIGSIIASATGINLIGFIIGGFIFLCSLPFLLIDSYIQSKIDYTQDREDFRESIRQSAEDDRMDKYIETIEEKGSKTNIFYDNRQINIHNNISKKSCKDVTDYIEKEL